jgi:hypothetical protein
MDKPMNGEMLSYRCQSARFSYVRYESRKPYVNGITHINISKDGQTATCYSRDINVITGSTEDRITHGCLIGGF